MNLRRIPIMLGVVGLLSCMALVLGCSSGDSEGPPPWGYVVKGPVYKSTVTYSDTSTALTETDGLFPYKALGVKASGGTYMDMKNVLRLSPDMAAPAGTRNITPLTTLYNYADALTRLKLQGLLFGTANIDTVVLGTVTSETKLVAKLNESLGEVLTQLKEGCVTSPASETYLAGLAAAIANNLAPAPDQSSASIAAAISANTVAAPVVINTAAVIAVADAVKAGTVVQPVVPANNLPVTIDLTTANVAQLDVSGAAFKFNVHPSSTPFTYGVANFAAGDKLAFDAGSAISLINTSGTDGALDVVGSLNGKAATVHLTGIAPASDGALFGGSSFNTVFGAGALAPTDAANVIVSAANAAPGYDASVAPVKFAVHPAATFDYYIANFAAGDKLVFDDGTAIDLTNTSGTDGVILITGSLGGHVVTLHLTGIAPSSDGAIFGVNTFNSVFGAGSLVNASGDIIVPPNTVSVDAPNTTPYDASTGAIVFSVHPTSSFIYNIANFAAGDKLVFDAGTALDLTNLSGTDGEIEISGSLNQHAVTVRLTGIAPAVDGAIFGVNNFNVVFGPGSLGIQQ